MAGGALGSQKPEEVHTPYPPVEVTHGKLGSQEGGGTPVVAGTQLKVDSSQIIAAGHDKSGSLHGVATGPSGMQTSNNSSQ